MYYDPIGDAGWFWKQNAKEISEPVNQVEHTNCKKIYPNTTGLNLEKETANNQ